MQKYIFFTMLLVASLLNAAPLQVRFSAPENTDETGIFQFTSQSKIELSSIPKVEGIHWLGTSSRQNQSFSNGRWSSSFTIQLPFKVLKAGKYVSVNR